MQDVPDNLRRLAIEIDGWLDFDQPDKALERVGPLLEVPEARPIGLALRIRARVALGDYLKALSDIEEARTFSGDSEWVDVTEAWCLKRSGDLPGAAEQMRKLLARDPKSAIGHYNLGCYLALLGQTQEALDKISIACGLEESYRKAARAESDLGSLREMPEFQKLIGEGG